MGLTKDERRALRRVLKMAQIRPGGFFLSLFLGVATLGAAIGLAATSAWLIARASQMPPVLYLTVAAVAVRMFGIMRAVFRYLQRIASHKVALDGMDSLRLGIYDALTSGPIEHVAQIKKGDLLKRTGADVDTVGDFVVKSLLPSLVTAIVAIGTVVGFAFLSIPAALVLLVCLLISGVVAPLFSMRSTRLGEASEQEAQRQLSITAMATLEGADELQVAGETAQSLARLDDDSLWLTEARKLAARPAAIGAALDRAAMGLAVVGVFLVATPGVASGAIAAVAFAVLVLTPLSAFEGTAELAPAAAQLVRSAGAALRIVDLLGPQSQPEPTHPVPHSPKAKLAVKDLSVGWPSGPVVASGFDFDLQPGDRIAIVGPSGIGKTTLLYTLAGMLEPKAGTVQVNGVEAWGADRSELAQVVSLTTEDAHVFATTVYENLRVARGDLTKAEAKLLLERMGLGEWLAGLPEGLDTDLGSGGTTISGGERRRLLLARALASPAPLMALDEPGEHLDQETVGRILTELLEGSGETRGIVMVTHRLSELSLTDRIIRLEAHSTGTAAHVYTHQQLVDYSQEYNWAVEQEK